MILLKAMSRGSSNTPITASTTCSSSSSSLSHYHSRLSKQLKQLKRDLTTELKLGLSLSPSAASQQGESIGQNLIKPVIQKMNAATAVDDYNDIEKSSSSRNTRRRLYVKAYIEGHAIGRKLDLLAHHGFHDMIWTLPTYVQHQHSLVHSGHYELHVLTYEDEEGDWLTVGDVPWDEKIEDHKDFSMMIFK